MKSVRHLLLGLFIAALPFSVNIAKADDVNRLSLGIGEYDVFDDQEAADFRIEYRPGASIIWELKPFLGAEVTSDGGIWAGAGFLYDLNLSQQWVLTPSLAAGLYSDGDGKDLGSAIEFRSQMELGYQFENASRISGAISHISNASIGDRNPGTEIISLYYHVPMNWISSSGY